MTVETEVIKKKRRVSSIPKLPDDENDETIITMPPTTLMANQDKILPPLPVAINASSGDKNDDLQSTLSVDSFASNNRSSIGLSTSLKSGPVVSATPTNVSSSDGFNSITAFNEVDTQLYQIRENYKETKKGNGDGLNNIEEDNNSSVMGSFIKNIANYSRQAPSTITESENIQLSTDNNANAVISDVFSQDTLNEGIKFESEKGTEMLTYRKSRRKSNNPLTVNTGSGTPNTHTKSRSLSTPVTAENLKNILASPQSSIGSSILNGTTPVVPTTPKVEIDYNLYVDEKYLDTQYRYASEKRNEEFHRLFTDVPKNDRLLDDFSCALSREILLQGRLYVSEHYLCFNSSLLGWVTTFVVSLDEIQKFERRSTVGLFPNGIIIETREAKHIFASFITRDQTLNFIETIWSKSISLSKKNHEKSREFEILQSKTSFESRNENVKLLSESDLYTIDGDSSSDGIPGDGHEDDEDEEDDSDDDEDEDDYDESDHDTANSEFKDIHTDTEKLESKDEVKSKLKSFKKNKFKGPRKHAPSSHIIDYSKDSEIIVLEKSYNVPIGVLYGIFFDDNIEFHKSMMVLNDGFNFTDYDLFEKEGDERAFEYDKKLNFPIGPSSTRVYCTEKLEHLDYNDYIEVINISKTPNVPSGTTFDCRTRYLFAWDENNQTKLTISFKLLWTGSSWFKGTIESSALSGQKKAASDVDNELLKILPQKIIELDLNASDKEIDEKEVSVENNKLKVEKVIKRKFSFVSVQPVVPTPAVKESIFDIHNRNNIIIYLLVIIVFIEFAILTKLTFTISSMNITLREQLKIVSKISERFEILEEIPG
jgi:hypothetical protein